MSLGDHPAAAGRLEDDRLLQGRGRFIEDLNLPGAAHAVVLRSPVAHARIAGLQAEQALSHPGVLTILTGAELDAEGIGSLPGMVPVVSRDGTPLISPDRPVLATDRVRHVGEPLALIVAETVDQARDAAEAVDIDFTDLPVVADITAAIAPDAPLVWPQAAGNTCFDWEIGDSRAVDDAIAAANHVCRLTARNNRQAIVPVETRGAVGDFDAVSGGLTLYTPSQGVHMLQRYFAQHVLHCDPAMLRVVTGDVGGSFGMKLVPYPEQVLVMIAARRLGRPVKWVADRSEAFVSDAQSRDMVSDAELALDEAGRFLALRIRANANLGAYLSMLGALNPTNGFTKVLGGIYTLPQAYCRVRGVFSNTVPIDAYRGAGKPEAIHLLERLIDKAARELGIDPAELRRRNFIPQDAMPYRTVSGTVIDCGDFAAVQDRALDIAGRAGFAERRAASERKGRRRGFGFASYVHATGGFPDDRAEVTVTGDGRVLVATGSQSSGQGHESAFATLVADRLEIDRSRVHLVQGDTARLAKGGGTGGSAGLPISATTIAAATDRALERGKDLAAHVLEAAVVDIDYRQGAFHIAGTDRVISIFDLALRCDSRPDDPMLAGGCAGAADFAGEHASFPNGTYVCEVEVDPETGAVKLLDFVAVDDVGRVLDRTIVDGQIQGGIVQGIGQALYEDSVFDPDTAQPVSGSLMDYALPRADYVPNLRQAIVELPTANNPLGMKGAGEIGTIGAPAAVINAIVDALAPLGVEHVDMPATPERIWRAIQTAASKSACSDPANG